MAKVSTATWWTVQPGKELEFIEANVRAKKIHMRLGAESAYLNRVQIGENTGQFIYQLTFASAEVYGKFLDAAGKDSEWMAFWAEQLAKSKYATIGSSRMVIGIEI